MNATERALERLKQHITTGSQGLYLSGEGLYRIRAVDRRAERQNQLQDLGAFTKQSIAYPLCDFEELKKQILAPSSNRGVSEQSAVIVKVQTQENPNNSTSSQEVSKLSCEVCKWHYPASYSSSDQQLHRDLAQRGLCAKDSAAFRRREERKTKQRMEKEKLMNGEDQKLEQFREVRGCPHCGLSLEGSWGEFKRNHLLECEARNLDRELNSIVCASALIPKKRPRPEQDRFAIAFTSLARKRLRSIE